MARKTKATKRPTGYTECANTGGKRGGSRKRINRASSTKKKRENDDLVPKLAQRDEKREKGPVTTIKVRSKPSDRSQATENGKETHQCCPTGKRVWFLEQTKVGGRKSFRAGAPAFNFLEAE